jgi:two-component system response regulator RegX3
MLPTLDGFSICEAIRQHTRELPIIMLTAKNTEEDIINGLSLGADDYVAKPFSVRELVLRVDAVLRRAGKDKKQQFLVLSESLAIDVDNLCAEQPGGKLLFTRREVDLLSYLKQNDQRPIPRQELLAQVWGYKKNSDIDTRTVDIHIAKLRKKIERNPKKPTLLLTIRGEGYKLVAEL